MQKVCIIQIDIFDFDGTTFRSPCPSSKLWGSRNVGRIINTHEQKGLGWYESIESLSPPFVPEVCDESWFSHVVLPEFRASCEDPSRLAVLLSGRNIKFYARIKSILEGVGLRPDLISLKEDPRPTMDFKRDLLSHLIAQHTEIKRIRVYEDREPHARKFQAFLRTCGVADTQVTMIMDWETILPEALERQLVAILEECAEKGPACEPKQKEKTRKCRDARSDPQQPPFMGRQSGRCVKWDVSRGFGFIQPKGSNETYFAHVSELKNGMNALLPGQLVEFSVQNGKDGRLKAVDLW